MLDDDDDLDDLEKALEQFARQEKRESIQQAKEEKQAKKDKRRRSTGAAKELKTSASKVVSTKGPPRRCTSLASGSKNLLGSLQHSEHTEADRRPSLVGSSLSLKKDSGSGATNAVVEVNIKSSNPKRDNRRKRGSSKLEREGSNRSLGSNLSLGSNKSLPLASLHSNTKEPKQSMVGSNRSLMSLCSPKDQLMNIFGDTSFLQKLKWPAYFGQHDDPESGQITPEIDYAVKSKSVKKLRRLWQRGVNMNATNDQGETLVHLVCRQGCSDMLMFLMSEAKVSVRVRDDIGKNPLHEVCWRPIFDPGLAMMLMSDSPELLWAPDARGFLALDYVPKRALFDYYEFMELKGQMLRLALKFSRFKASSRELSKNQERLKLILERQLSQ